MRYKAYRLQNEIDTLTKRKEYLKHQAKMSKYASIFAGTGSSIVAIIVIINAMNPNINNDQTSAIAFFAFVLAIATYGANETAKQSKKQAELFKKTINKRNRTLQKLTKTR